jgi:hypothetical protein
MKKGNEMNRKFSAASLALGVLTAGLAFIAHAAGDESSKIEQLVKEMRQAQKDNDVAWYKAHIADGYIEGHSWGEWATKDQLFKEIQDKANTLTKSEISDIKVSTFGPNVAVAHYKFTYDATFNGTHRARAVICSDTWISQSGAWKMAANHCSHVEGT